MRNALFVAWQHVRHQLRQGATLVWVFVMPPIFFFFIGTVTGGFSAAVSGGQATPLTVISESPGFLQAQIDLRLTDNGFATRWVTPAEAKIGHEAEPRTLTIDGGLSDKILGGQPIGMRYDTSADALLREAEVIRIQRSVYTLLADIVVADALSTRALDAAALVALNAAPRIWQLDVSPAGRRLDIPTGFEQAIPGTLVMFTLLVLLTSGGTMLVAERDKGLLRRLASAPISRGEVVAGKWGGRMALGALQIVAALAIGTVLFDMDWGPDFAAVLLVLVAWAGFCASAGLWLGRIARTQGQASGLGVLAANGLAALGGCWWPIEITDRKSVV